MKGWFWFGLAGLCRNCWFVVRILRHERFGLAWSAGFLLRLGVRGEDSSPWRGNRRNGAVGGATCVESGSLSEAGTSWIFMNRTEELLELSTRCAGAACCCDVCPQRAEARSVGFAIPYRDRMAELIQSRLLRQSQRYTFETDEVRLIKVRGETLARCKELQQHVAKPLVFALDTALKLQCIDVPGSFDSQDLSVVATSRSERRRINGVRCAEWSYALQTVMRDGVECVAPGSTWLMAARFLDLHDLVLLGDAMMRRSDQIRVLQPSIFRTLCDDIEAELATRKRRAPVGFRNCRRALWLMRANTDSFMESQLRLALVSHGLPCPEVNHQVTCTGMDGKQRRFYLDLAYPEVKVAVEYDGRQHADNWEYDQARNRALDDAQWLRLGVFRPDLANDARRMEIAKAVAERMERRCRTKVPVRDPLPLHRLADRWRRKAEAAKAPER